MDSPDARMNAPPDFRAPHEPLTPEATALARRPRDRAADHPGRRLARRHGSSRRLAALARRLPARRLLRRGAARRRHPRPQCAATPASPSAPEPVTPHQTTSAGGGARKGDKLVRRATDRLGAAQRARADVPAHRRSRGHPGTPVRAALDQSVADQRRLCRQHPALQSAAALRRGFPPSGDRYAEPVTEMADADVSITKRDLADMPIVPGKANLHRRRRRQPDGGGARQTSPRRSSRRLADPASADAEPHLGPGQPGCRRRW